MEIWEQQNREVEVTISDQVWRQEERQAKHKLWEAQEEPLPREKPETKAPTNPHTS